MSFFFILPNYLIWHYSYAFNDIANIWKNFVVFIYNVFSIPTLLFTLFSPWMKMNDGYNINQSLLNTFIFNSMMRLFGVFVRLIFIIIGLVTLALTLVLGVAFFILWAFLPFVLSGVLFWSIKNLFF